MTSLPLSGDFLLLNGSGLPSSSKDFHGAGVGVVPLRLSEDFLLLNEPAGVPSLFVDFLPSETKLPGLLVSACISDDFTFNPPAVDLSPPIFLVLEGIETSSSSSSSEPLIELPRDQLRG